MKYLRFAVALIVAMVLAIPGAVCVVCVFIAGNLHEAGQFALVPEFRATPDYLPARIAHRLFPSRRKASNKDS